MQDKIWITQILEPHQKYIDPLYIPFYKNIPLRENSV